MSAKDRLEKKFNITVSDNALNLSQIQEGMPHYRVETDCQNLICEKFRALSFVSGEYLGNPTGSPRLKVLISAFQPSL